MPGQPTINFTGSNLQFSVGGTRERSDATLDGAKVEQGKGDTGLPVRLNAGSAGGAKVTGRAAMARIPAEIAEQMREAKRQAAFEGAAAKVQDGFVNKKIDAADLKALAKACRDLGGDWKGRLTDAIQGAMTEGTTTTGLRRERMALVAPGTEGRAAIDAALSADASRKATFGDLFSGIFGKSQGAVAREIAVAITDALDVAVERTDRSNWIMDASKLVLTGSAPEEMMTPFLEFCEGRYSAENVEFLQAAGLYRAKAAELAQANVANPNDTTIPEQVEARRMLQDILSSFVGTPAPAAGGAAPTIGAAAGGAPREVNLSYSDRRNIKRDLLDDAGLLRSDIVLTGNELSDAIKTITTLVNGEAGAFETSAAAQRFVETGSWT